jgi:hypothetical protein
MSSLQRNIAWKAFRRFIAQRKLKTEIFQVILLCRFNSNQYIENIAVVHNQFIQRPKLCNRGCHEKIETSDVHRSSGRLGILRTNETYSHHVQSEYELQPAEADSKRAYEEQASRN